MRTVSDVQASQKRNEEEYHRWVNRRRSAQDEAKGLRSLHDDVTVWLGGSRKLGFLPGDFVWFWVARGILSLCVLLAAANHATFFTLLFFTLFCLFEGVVLHGFSSYDERRESLRIQINAARKRSRDCLQKEEVAWWALREDRAWLATASHAE